MDIGQERLCDILNFVVQSTNSTAVKFLIWLKTHLLLGLLFRCHASTTVTDDQPQANTLSIHYYLFFITIIAFI